MGSEMGEIYYAMRKAKQERKQANKANGTEKIKRSGYSFVTHNDGLHIVIENRVDYWPSTGKFIDRQTKRKGRGILPLLKYLYGIIKQTN